MRKIIIYGHSDDLLEIEGDRLPGEPGRDICCFGKAERCHLPEDHGR